MNPLNDTHPVLDALPDDARVHPTHPKAPAQDTPRSASFNQRPSLRPVHQPVEAGPSLQPQAPVRMLDHSAIPQKVKGASLHEAYQRNVMIGLIFSLALLIGLVRAPLFPTDKTVDVKLFEQETVQMEEIAQTEQVIKPPPPPRPPVPVEVPNDTILEDDDLDLDATLDIGEALVELPPPPISAPEAVEEVVEEEPEIFVVVEQMPEIVGGIARVYELISYPEIARQAGLEGMVVVGLVVEPNGLPTNLNVIKSAGPMLDEAALEAIRKLTFTPGKQRNVPVRVQLNIPITFRLRNAKQ